MNSIQGSKIVVVGGAGFIGSHLVDQLLEEPVGQVTIYDNFVRGRWENLREALKDERAKVHEGDIRDIAGLNKVLEDADHVFHLAALWLLHCQDHPREAAEVNMEGTLNVLVACRDQGIKKLIYSSSASVYGDAVEVPMREEHPLNNRTFYGATKIAGEQMCRAFFERYGLHYVGLRYMNVYGPRQNDQGPYTNVILKMLDRLDQGLPPVVYGDGSQTYDFIHVKDVARANVCALKSEANDAFYNVGCGVGTSIRDLATLILRLTGASRAIQFEPGGQTFVTRRIAATQRTKEELSFVSSLELEAGLQDLIQWRKRERLIEQKGGGLHHAGIQ